MNIENITESAKIIVHDYLGSDTSGHDYFHCIRVYEMATVLAKKYNADLFIVQLASLLHDLDDRKLSPDTYNNKIRAVDFMNKHNLDLNIIMFVTKIIHEIDYKGEETVIPDTLEGKIVQDADRLDSLGAIGVARCFMYNGNKGIPLYLPDYKPNNIMDAGGTKSSAINHFYEKLFKIKDLMNTDLAREIANERTEYMKQFVYTFMREWNFEDI